MGDNEMTTSVGWIGAGRMGYALIERLLDAGYDVSVYNRTRSKAEPLAERGMRCPDDVSVVGFNDMPFMDKVSPPMTTVRIRHYELGAEAARLLLEVLHDPDRHPRSLLLPLTMVIRSSTGPVPAPRAGD